MKRIERYHQIARLMDYVEPFPSFGGRQVHTTSSVAEFIGVSPRYARTLMTSMAEIGMLKVDWAKHRPGIEKGMYSITSEGRKFARTGEFQHALFKVG